MTTTEQFLNRLHGDAPRRYLWTADTKRSMWYAAGEPLPSVNGYESVYYGVYGCTTTPTHNAKGKQSSPEWVRAQLPYVDQVNALLGDFDAKDFVPDLVRAILAEHGAAKVDDLPKEAKGPILQWGKPLALAHVKALEPPASIIIDSGGGYHAMWLLSEPFYLDTEADRARAAKTLKGWVEHVGGDPGAADLARVLRLPGSENHKYSPARPVDFVLCDLTQTYSLPNLESCIPQKAGEAKGLSPCVHNEKDDVERARRALARLAPDRADGYASWVHVGMMLCELGQPGLELWRDWSRQSGKYSDGDCDEKWPTFTPGKAGGVTLGSLFYLASIDAPEASEFRATAQAVNASPDPGDPGDPGDQVGQEPQERKVSTWPYAISGGRLVYLTQKGEELLAIQHKIADFEARIAQEVTTEDGERSYLVRGKAIKGGPFEIEIPAEDFAEDRKLKAALDAGAGARDPVHAGMAKHLGPAIKLCTGSDLVKTRRFHRTGWAGRRFLLPGREPSGVEIALPRKLPYGTGPGDLAHGLEALEALIRAMGPERGAVLLAFILQGPAAALSDLRNERYALHVTGRTGALKTSTCQCAMSVWGSGFMSDHALIKWGEGATGNAIMSMATHAHDLPLMLDNFKPGTGGGVRAYVTLIHNILEGGEKDRLNRAAQLKDTRPVFCWPLVTGEDVPDIDPASLARVLVLPFAWQRGEQNAHLTRAQALSEHLPTIGAAWLDWLESDQGRAAAKRAGGMFADRRAAWAVHLRGLDSDMVNILRVASNLASNELAYLLLREHPTLGSLFDAYTEAHTAGLATIAGTMAESTAHALEGHAYLGALRDLLSADQVYLLPKEQEYPVNTKEDPYRPGFIGWHDGGEGAYLIPDVTRKAIENLIGRDRLGHLSNSALYAQLAELGAIKSATGDKSTKVLWIAGKSKRVLHIGAGFLSVQGEDSGD